jgi:hypothetical protein
MEAQSMTGKEIVEYIQFGTCSHWERGSARGIEGSTCEDCAAHSIDAAVATLTAEVSRLTEKLPCGHLKHVNDDTYGGCLTCTLQRCEAEDTAEIARLTEKRDALQAATRRLVEAAQSAIELVAAGDPMYAEEVLTSVLADPILVALRRE